MPAFVSSAETAYIADLSDRQINRLVDEAIAPSGLIQQEGNTRRFRRFYAALAMFYCETEPVFQSKARRQIMQEVVSHVEALPGRDQIYDLAYIDKESSRIWLVELKGVPVNVEPYIARCLVRAKEVDQADALIQTNGDILGGTPVFLGTRLPIENVLAALERGTTAQELIAEYPMLRSVHIEAARVYDAVHPRRGRPRRLQELHPDLVLKSKRILRAART